MKIKKIVAAFFLIVLGLGFLISCTLIDQQTKKETKETPQITPPAPVEVQPLPKAIPKETKEPPPKDAETTREAHPPTKIAPKPPVQKTPEAPGESQQQKYYNMGMRYYSQEKYAEAKKAWQRVIKLGKRTALANKARENIKKIDQILKTLREISGK